MKFHGVTFFSDRDASLIATVRFDKTDKFGWPITFRIIGDELHSSSITMFFVSQKDFFYFKESMDQAYNEYIKGDSNV